MHFKSSIFAIASLMIAMPVVAQNASAPAAPAATAPTVGATVYGPGDEVVGTIDSITGDTVVLAIDGNKVGLALSSIGAGAKGPAIGLSKADMLAAANKAQADAAGQLQAQLTPGAAVHTQSDNVEVGKVKEADASFVTLTTEKGEVRLPINAFAAGSAGPVIGMTAAQFESAIAGVQPQQ